MKSMTGFGRGIAVGAKGTVTTEIKTVNSRFLEINMRTDHFSPAAENAAKQLIQEKIARGKMYVNIAFEKSSNQDNTHVLINEDLLNAYIASLNEVRKKTGVRNKKPSVSDLFLLPEPFLQVKTDKLTDEDLIPIVKESVLAALAGLEEMRTHEGDNLALDLKKRIDFLREKLSFLTSMQETVIMDYEARLRDRMLKLLEDLNAQIDEGRFLEEVAIYAEKTDFTEELTRFGSHLDQFEHALEGNEPTGRKLDFLLQEINREINTTASKANDIEVVNCVIIIKTELEKIREQVQNIE